jgi:glyoxylase I family protein
MRMTLNVSGLDHIALRVTSIAHSKAFYTETLGFEVAVEIPTLVLVTGYGIRLGMRGDEAQTPQGDHFDPYRVGLDHLALAVPERSALDGLKNALDAAGVRHNGIQENPLSHAPYISFYDPDGIAWEFYVSDPPQG